jgi:hypothetical protein
MIDKSVGRAIKQSPTRSIGGYRVGSGTESGNGYMDGLILLICAVGQQAIRSKCECDGCKRWIDLYKDWGMDGNDMTDTRVQHRVHTEQKDTRKGRSQKSDK